MSATRFDLADLKKVQDWLGQCKDVPVDLICCLTFGAPRSAIPPTASEKACLLLILGGWRLQGFEANKLSWQEVSEVFQELGMPPAPFESEAEMESFFCCLASVVGLSTHTLEAMMNQEEGQ